MNHVIIILNIIIFYITINNFDTKNVFCVLEPYMHKKLH